MPIINGKLMQALTAAIAAEPLSALESRAVLLLKQGLSEISRDTEDREICSLANALANLPYALTTRDPSALRFYLIEYYSAHAYNPDLAFFQTTKPRRPGFLRSAAKRLFQGRPRAHRKQS